MFLVRGLMAYCSKGEVLNIYEDFLNHVVQRSEHLGCNDVTEESVVMTQQYLGKQLCGKKSL